MAYTVAANTGTAARTGTLTIAGKTYTVTQAGVTTAAPVCTLSANPASITTGGSSTLTASCTPAASSYAWTGGTCAGTTGATCTVTPTATTTYTVTGTNAGGTGAAASATVTVSATTSTLQPNADGTVTDSKTGLTWMRCAMGQTWDGTTCSGTVSTYTFDQASALIGTVTFAGQNDWRLPNIRELQTIVDRSVYYPAIDSAAFPNTPSLYFWSNTPTAYYSSYAWTVIFNYGGTYDYDRSHGDGAVRLVRSGQPFGSLMSITRPAIDYVDNGNGTVTHMPTNLTWKRCTEGQTWNGSTCSGTTKTYTYDQANALTGTVPFAGQSDWRLPTEDELLSLEDYSTFNPAINPSIFPATPGLSFWSSSLLAGSSSDAWFTNFGVGGAFNGYRSYANAARLVRSGQSIGSLALTISKSGTGTGTVTSAPAGINCGSTCSAVLASGTSVTLTATPATGSTFSGWGGACTGTGSCTVSMTAAQSVTATFTNRTGFDCNAPPAAGVAGLTLTGNGSNELFSSSAGSDTIDGAGGVNTVVYLCNRANFTLTATTTGWVASSVAEGFDKLSNLQRLQFADKTLALDISGNAGQAYRIYQAAFNRTPDSGGLKYWIEQMDKGMGLLEVAARFVDSDEFRSLYGTNPVNASFLTKLYNNVLHRQPEQSGYDWWLDELNSGRRSQTKALADFSESDENKAGVLPAIQNGIELPN